MGMLNRDKRIILCIFCIFCFALIKCTGNKNRTMNEMEAIYKAKCVKLLGSENEYNLLYKKMSDTVNSWVLNELLSDTAKENNLTFYYKYKVDSIFYLNSKKDKIIGALLHDDGFQSKYFTDGISEFYGAKIKDKWYFWKGGYMPIIRKSYKNHHPTKPLSYQQLHKAAMENFLGGYLTKSGEINDAWFESKFKSGRYTFDERYEYEWILDGKKIEDEDESWKWTYENKGKQIWIMKAYSDSLELLKRAK